MAVTFIALFVFLLPVAARFAIAFGKSWRSLTKQGSPLLVLRERRILFEPVRVAGHHEHTARLEYRWPVPCTLRNLAMPEACSDFLVLEVALHRPHTDPLRCKFDRPLPALCFMPEYFSSLVHLPELRSMLDGFELTQGCSVVLKVRNRSSLANDFCARLVGEMSVPCPEPARVLS